MVKAGGGVRIACKSDVSALGFMTVVTESVLLPKSFYTAFLKAHLEFCTTQIADIGFLLLHKIMSDTTNGNELPSICTGGHLK
jgi:hypothetical protein